MFYTAFKCKKCRREFILDTEEYKAAEREGMYIACPFCSSRKVVIGDSEDDLKKLMESGRVYVRRNGAIIQKR